MGVISVKVMGHTFTVKQMSDYEAKDADGYCLHGPQEIRIAPGLHRDCEWETLIHEMVEAYNVITDSEMSHQSITLLANFIFSSFGSLTW